MAETTVIRCPACGAKNRVSMDRIIVGQSPVCGKCKADLPVGAGQLEPTVVTDDTFREQVDRSTIPVLVDMWAPWCGPCRLIAPIIDQLAVEMAGRVRFAKVNVDENPHTAGRFNVNSIPTLLIVKSGREVDRIVGVQPTAEIRRRLEQVASGC
jgi:thioredoxin 2